MSKKEEQQEVKRMEERREEKKKALISVLICLIIMDLLITYFTFLKRIQSKIITEAQVEEAEEKGYECGYYKAVYTYNVIGDIIMLYRSEDITYEQLETYIDSRFNLVNLSLSNSEITLDDIEKYNNIINEIQLINYEMLQIESSGENYLRGFKEYIQMKSYCQMVEYYYKQKLIPADKLYSMKVAFTQNTMGSVEEEKIEKIINYGRKLIEEYIGNPDEIIISTEWREYISIEDFLTKF